MRVVRQEQQCRVAENRRSNKHISNVEWIDVLREEKNLNDLIQKGESISNLEK